MATPPAGRTVLTSAALVALAAGALHLLGVAGWRWGGVTVAAILAVGGSVLVWRRLGRGAPSKVTWAATFAISGLVLTGWLGQHAPPSKGALGDILDEAEFAFWDEVDEKASGHSWCRPTCPVLTRIYDVPDTGDAGILLTAATGLDAAGFPVENDDYSRTQRGKTFSVSGRRATAEVRIVEGRERRASVTLRANR